MTRKDSDTVGGGRFWLVAGLGLTMALGGCGLDEVDIPDLDGPSGLGTSLYLTASPDLITADGFSTSVVTATVYNQNGRPVAGRDIFFAIADESGRFADIGNFRGSNGPGTGMSVRTDTQGVARAIYEAPQRTDATANQRVTISVRPVGVDALAAVYRAVQIELRSAEPRLFPPNPGNAVPNCNFVVEAPNGFRTNVAILFQTTSNDPDGVIVRYEWDFGNGTGSYAPDNAAIYRSAGAYTVTHQVTDDDGAQARCQAAFSIRN